MSTKLKSLPKVTFNRDFAARYTKDSDGFYVRNRQPSPSTLNDERISDSVRELLRDVPDVPEDKT